MDSWPDLLESALRVATVAHASQTRKASDVPYITHPVAVAMILQQFGFADQDTLAAALLHDVVEDTSTTIEQLSEQFPDPVLELVAHLTEVKFDQFGRKRPWEDRKRDHLAHIRSAPLDARAIALADKLHNLRTMAYELDAGQQVLDRFNASFDRLLWYYESMIEGAASQDVELGELAKAARLALYDVRQRLQQ